MKVRQEDTGKTWERGSRLRQDLRQSVTSTRGSASSLTQLYTDTQWMGHLIVHIFIILCRNLILLSNWSVV